MKSKEREIAVFSIIAIFALTVTTSSPFLAQISKAQKNGETTPSPPSIGSKVPLTYFGPSPSEVDPQLIGPVKLLKQVRLT